MSAEATVVRNYLDWMTELPWHKKSEVDIDLAKAQNTLDKDHFGLEKIKERIVEFLAVMVKIFGRKTPLELNYMQVEKDG
jgi:ATP-dependent Lon protease